MAQEVLTWFQNTFLIHYQLNLNVPKILDLHFDKIKILNNI